MFLVYLNKVARIRWRVWFSGRSNNCSTTAETSFDVSYRSVGQFRISSRRPSSSRGSSFRYARRTDS